MTRWIDVAAVGDVAADEVVGVDADGKPIALFLVDDDYFALYDLCSHGQARLSDGFVEDGNIECPLHQGLICIRTGTPKSAPITEAVTRFPTRVNRGRIEIEM